MKPDFLNNYISFQRTDNIGSLLTSFGMTQLPLLNFAQLLAAHGAPLMPAQLSALMSALQNYNEPTPRLGGAVCEQVIYLCILERESLYRAQFLSISVSIAKPWSHI